MPDMNNEDSPSAEVSDDVLALIMTVAEVCRSQELSLGYAHDRYIYWQGEIEKRRRFGDLR
jgi:hypothetical protein